jgi:hypothetical protein
MSAIDNAVAHYKSIETKVIEVPEWGDDNANPLKIYCRPITLIEMKKFMALAKDDEVEMLVYVLIYKALDESGDKIYTLEHKHALLNSVDSGVLVRVATEVMGNISQGQIAKK